MHLIGARNWALPGWLDRLLPNLSVEAATEAGPSVPEPAVPVPVAS
jgi:RND superfamily putative drug exporter